jgi:hypothetical protein
MDVRPIATAVLAGSALAAGCGDDQRFAVTGPALAPYLGLAPSLCLPFVDVDGADERHSDCLHDLEFSWGVAATVRYHTEDVPDLADGPSFIHVVDEVLDRRPDPVGTLYTVAFSWPDLGDTLFGRRDDGALDMLLQYPRACEPALCTQLLAMPTPFELDVELTGLAIPIRAIAARPTR